MLQNSSEMTFNGSYRFNTERVDDGIPLHNIPEPSSMSTTITGVTTTTESKVDRAVCLDDAETTDISTKTGLLKRLLIGCTILTGVGVLAAGGYYCYRAGRQSAGGYPEKMRLPHSSEPPTPLGKFLREARETDGGSLTMLDYDSRSGVNSTLTPETSLSPYSHYEGIYGKPVATTTKEPVATTTKEPVATTTKESVATTTKESVATTTKEPAAITTREPAVTTTKRATSAYMVMKPIPVLGVSSQEVKLYNHDRIRDIHYRALVGDYEFPRPLGPVFHSRVSGFCYSKKVKDIIDQAYGGDAELRCTLLSHMVKTINKFKYNESKLLGMHDRQEVLSRYEYAQEVMMRRKLTTLLMAAEFIIDGKNFSEFYAVAMKDYKRYSISELTIKEKAILTYFPEHKCFG